MKDKDIQRVMRFLKEVSVDCFLHYNRNYRPTDKDFSPECNYEVCKYECAVERPPSDEIDYSMYDILYSKPEVDAAKVVLQKMFENTPSFSFESIVEKMPDFRKATIVKALYELSKDRTPLIDKFGVYVYLREDNGTFFVQREYPNYLMNSTYAMSEYVYNTPLISENLLSQVLIDTAIETVKEKIKGGKMGEKDIENLDLVQRMAYIEEMARKEAMEKVKIDEPYYNKYKNRIYHDKEPQVLLEEQAKGTAIWEKRGKKPKDIENVKIKPLSGEKLDVYRYKAKEGDNIWFHSLLTYETTTMFERFAKGDGIVRVMKESEDFVWRDANPYEIVVYNGMIQVQVNDLLERLDKEPYYGYVDFDEVKIMDNMNKPKERKKNIKGKEDEVDKRTRTKGIECGKFITENKKNFEDTFNVKIKYCEDIVKVLDERGLMLYLTL